MTFTAKVRNVKPVLAELKRLEPETFKKLKRDMRKDVMPLVNLIKAKIPPQSPFQGSIRDGFDHNGRTAWRKTNPQSITISTPTSVRGRAASTVVTIIENSAAVAITDKAGMRGERSGRQPQKRFNQNISRKLGPSQRFGFKTAIQNKALVEGIINNIIDKVEAATNANIRRIF